MAVVAIAQQIGSRGLELAGLIAARLRYPLLGPHEIAEETSREYKITPDVFSLFDERQPGWWQRLAYDRVRLAAYFRAVILKHMSSCNVVVVGRSIPLIMPRNTRHCLRLRIVAPLDFRVREVMREENLDVAAAERRVHHYDQEVRARIQLALGLDLEEHSPYDLIINTASRPMRWFVSMIADVAAAIDREADRRSIQVIKDESLAAQIRAALLAHSKIGQAPIEAEVCRAEGRPSDAATILREELPLCVPGNIHFEVNIWQELAPVYRDLQQPARGREHLTRCREILVADEAWRGLVGPIERTAAESRFDAVNQHLAKAVEIYRRYQVPFEEAEALHYWGRALLAAGDDSGALEKLAAAMDLYQRHGAGEAWLERVRADQLRAKAADPINQIVPTLDRAPASRQLERHGETGEVSGLQGVFRKEGDYWTLSYEGPKFRLRDVKGLRYVAYLLANPGQEFAAQNLVSVIAGTGGDLGGANKGTNQRHSVHTATVDFGDAGVGLDAKAKLEYQCRIAELKEELEVAEQNNDLGRTVKIRQELDFIRDQLSASIGLRGRDRKVASHAERARLMVTKAIKSALQRIRQEDVEMGRHLALSIQTGYFCTYFPRSPITWQL